MLIVDEQAALRAISGLMPEAIEARREGLVALRTVIEASGAPAEAQAERLRCVAPSSDWGRSW
jgi:hypothetical protein